MSSRAATSELPARADPAACLAAWERGRPLDRVGRGLVLLDLACPGLSPDEAAAVPIGERDRRLLRLRGELFGTHLTGLVDCPACGERLEFEASVDALASAPSGDPAESLTMRDEDLDLALRLPDSRDLRASLECADARSAARALIARCIVSARRDGVVVATDTLPTDVLARAADRLAAADPQSDVRLAHVCTACGARGRTPFDIVSFLWAELEARVERVLWEIHVLAQAYGWTEREVLAIGPARREAYLRMVLG